MDCVWFFIWLGKKPDSTLPDAQVHEAAFLLYARYHEAQCPGSNLNHNVILALAGNYVATMLSQACL